MTNFSNNSIYKKKKKKLLIRNTRLNSQRVIFSHKHKFKKINKNLKNTYVLVRAHPYVRIHINQKYDL
jgi:hypothetical protein